MTEGEDHRISKEKVSALFCETNVSSVGVVCIFFILVALTSFLYNWSNMLNASLFALGSIFLVIGGINNVRKYA